MKIEITKRGEKWSCCDRWREGEECACGPYVVEFVDNAQPVREGPRPSDTKRLPK